MHKCICMYVFTHVCAVCVPDHAKSCVATWADIIIHYVVVVSCCAPVSYCFSCWLCMSSSSSSPPPLPLQSLWPSSFAVNSWKNHKNKSKRIFECNSSEYISSHPFLALTITFATLAFLPRQRLRQRQRRRRLSCRVAQFCSFCPLNTLSSSVALFFWSWFVLSFNVLRTQAHVHIHAHVHTGRGLPFTILDKLLFLSPASPSPSLSCQ